MLRLKKWTSETVPVPRYQLYLCALAAGLGLVGLSVAAASHLRATAPPKPVTRGKRATASSSSSDRSEARAGRRATQLVFWDLETTIPSHSGQAQEIIEFGSLSVDPCTFAELSTYQTLVHSLLITQRSVDCNHITAAMVSDAPSFAQVASAIFRALDGHVWAGHNLAQFDIPILEKAFARAGLPPPRPLLVIDTLLFVRRRYKGRTQDLKLATLGARFGLGVEAHRSLEDCRMNLDAFRNIALAYILERDFGLVAFPDQSVLFYPDQLKALFRLPSSSSLSLIASSSSSSPIVPVSSTPSTPVRPRPPPVVDDVDPAILQALDQALQSSTKVWIIYSLKPDMVRCLTPTAWIDRPRKFNALCHFSKTTKTFLAGRVMELRSAPWTPAPPIPSSHETQSSS